MEQMEIGAWSRDQVRQGQVSSARLHPGPGSSSPGSDPGSGSSRLIFASFVSPFSGSPVAVFSWPRSFAPRVLMFTPSRPMLNKENKRKTKFVSNVTREYNLDGLETGKWLLRLHLFTANGGQSVTRPFRDRSGCTMHTHNTSPRTSSIPPSIH
jgi:hypothetical protein